MKTNFDGNLMAARPTLKEIARMSGRESVAVNIFAATRESFLYIYSVTSNDNVIIVRSLRTRRISSGRERRRGHQKAIGAPFQHGSRGKEAENGKKTHDSEDQREDEAAVTSGVTMIAEVNFDGKFQRGAHEGGRRERERELITLP